MIQTPYIGQTLENGSDLTFDLLCDFCDELLTILIDTFARLVYEILLLENVKKKRDGIEFTCEV